MKFLSIILLAFTMTVKGQTHWQFSKDTVIQWSLINSDEFNGSQIDREKWYIGFPWGKALMSQLNYVVEYNFDFQSGYLNFITRPLDSLIELLPYEIDSNYLGNKKTILIDGNKFKFNYSTALLWSKHLYKYGYFEIKFKGVKGQGIWPAFWLYGGNPNYEIDFFELKGENEKALHVDLHCPNGCANFKEGILGYRRGWGHWITTNKKLYKNFNVIGGEWTEKHVKWYLNGQLIAIADQHIDVPMALVVGTGVATNDGPFKPGANSKTPFPNLFTVDYIRVYQLQSQLNLSKTTLIDERVASVTEIPGSFAASKAKPKLKHSPKKFTQEPIVSVSIDTVPGGFVLRVLGIQNGETVKLFFTHNEAVIDEYKVDENQEKTFRVLGLKGLSIKIEAVGHSISHRL
jgi:beta-glucanase (GH16 family)